MKFEVLRKHNDDRPPVRDHLFEAKDYLSAAKHLDMTLTRLLLVKDNPILSFTGLKGELGNQYSLQLREVKEEGQLSSRAPDVSAVHNQ
jgi:hypothetical protein